MKYFRHMMVLCAWVVSVQWIAAQTNGHFLHTVTKGQGLYSISRMYGVTEAEIVALNPGSDVVIKVGQQLRIPQKSGELHMENDGQRFHTIKTGETLYRLTVIYGVSAREICEANPGLSAQNFKVGQVIVIPAGNVTQQTETGQRVTKPDPMIGKVGEKKVQKQEEKKEKKRCRTEHQVKRRENIYRLSRMYGITELELVEANPELKSRKLKRGETICIPYAKKEQKEGKSDGIGQTDDMDRVEEEKPAVVPTNEQLFAGIRGRGEDIGQIKAAIILPFMLEEDSITNDQMKMVEYYEGFLMAVDSLKKIGVSVDLHVYDSGDEKQSIAPILARPEMKEMNVIFGPMHSRHIAEAADFVDSMHVKMVVPFERNVDEVFTNPYIYQVNTPQSYFYNEVTDHFIRQFAQPNVIFFESPEEDNDPYVASLMQELGMRDIPYTVLPADTATNKDTIRSRLDIERKNILMMTSSGSGSLNNMIPVFQLLVRDTATVAYDIQLFGYPQYQVYTNNHLASFYEIDTYFYSSFYTNNLLPAAVDFHRNFRRTYSKEIVNRFPKYAMLGFDTGFYFLKALHLYGSDMEYRLDEMEYTPIQTGFKFERVNNWGGFINRKVFFVHMSRDYMLQKIDFD